MTEETGVPIGHAEIGTFRRIFRGFSYFLIGLLAATGMVAIAVAAFHLRSGTVWTPDDINRLLDPASPTMLFAGALWANFKWLVEHSAYLFAAMALFIASTQIKTVSHLMRDFVKAKGAIYQLTETMASAAETGALLRVEADRLSQLEPTIKLMAEKLDENVLRIGALQRLTVSERVGEVAEGDVPAGVSNGLTGPPDEEDNWEKLRELWNANGARLDVAIERIPDKRKRSRFARMDRRNYPAIIDGLAADDFISPVAREGSLRLNREFMRFRVRNRRVPDQLIADLMVLDRMLEAEFSKNMPPQGDGGGGSSGPVDKGALETV